jgi:hypothetical protein
MVEKDKTGSEGEVTNMCKVITPGGEHEHGHGPVDEPAGIAELLRESLIGELETTGDLMARLEMIEDAEVSHALFHLIEKKRRITDDLWLLLRRVEDRFFESGETHGHTHSH